MNVPYLDPMSSSSAAPATDPSNDEERERPPLPRPMTKFHLRWASAAEKTAAVPLLRSRGRQTMNLRTMPGAKLLLLSTAADGVDRCMGWGGVDIESHPRYPELFSLFVEPAARGSRLGLVLELARYTYALEHAVRTAYVRMSVTMSADLMHYRIEHGLYRRLETSTLDPEYTSACRSCELYGGECDEQVYFAVDVERFVRQGADRIGPIDMASLPRAFEIDPTGQSSQLHWCS